MHLIRKALTLAATALTFAALTLTGCDDPNDNVGDRCARAVDCTPPLVCSNRDAPDTLGVCVYPEALPDAAVTSDATPTTDASGT